MKYVLEKLLLIADCVLIIKVLVAHNLPLLPILSNIVLHWCLLDTRLIIIVFSESTMLTIALVRSMRPFSCARLIRINRIVLEKI